MWTAQASPSNWTPSIQRGAQCTNCIFGDFGSSVHPTVLAYFPECLQRSSYNASIETSLSKDENVSPATSNDCDSARLENKHSNNWKSSIVQIVGGKSGQIQLCVYSWCMNTSIYFSWSPSRFAWTWIRKKLRNVGGGSQRNNHKSFPCFICTVCC